MWFNCQQEPSFQQVVCFGQLKNHHGNPVDIAYTSF